MKGLWLHPVVVLSVLGAVGCLALAFLVAPTPPAKGAADAYEIVHSANGWTPERTCWLEGFGPGDSRDYFCRREAP